MNIKHKNMIEYITEGLLNLVFPLDCRVCGQPIKESKGYSICENCFKTIKLIDIPYCIKCSKPLSVSNEIFRKYHKVLCLECKNKKYSFEFARSIGIYNGVLKECIQLFKYGRETKLSRPLAELLINYLVKDEQLKGKIDLIIPVPLHNNDLRKRGFNQSILLGRIIGKYFSIPVQEEVLIKKKLTPSQVNLSKEEREKNIIGVFSVDKSAEIKGANILILDDIFTTGSTSEECAKELKKAKVNDIFVLTLARSVLN